MADLVVEVVFTVAVSLAVLAVFSDAYAEYVLVAALVAVVWQLTQALGASLALATMLVLVTTSVRAVAILLGVAHGGRGLPILARILDGVLAVQTRPGQGPDRQQDRR